MTTTTIIATLSTYGFETCRADLFWGIGSLVWGTHRQRQGAGL